MESNADITVIYFPLLPNLKVESIDPAKTDFISTWNFIYTPNEVDKVVSLARANFKADKDQTKRTIRTIYEQKKKLKEQREGQG